MMSQLFGSASQSVAREGRGSMRGAQEVQRCTWGGGWLSRARQAASRVAARERRIRMTLRGSTASLRAVPGSAGRTRGWQP